MFYCFEFPPSVFEQQNLRGYQWHVTQMQQTVLKNYNNIRKVQIQMCLMYNFLTIELIKSW